MLNTTWEIATFSGRVLSWTTAQAVKWYRRATEQGHVSAQFNLGVCCSQGKGVPRDHGDAVKWFHKAAEQGSALAQYSLAQCYERGEGVQQDDSEAVNWYQKAAELETMPRMPLCVDSRHGGPP